MNRTGNHKPLKTLLLLALAIMLCVGTTLPALASGLPITGDETDPATAALTKILTMPENTTTPTATFTFEFDKVSINGLTGASDLTSMPGIADVTATFGAADTGSTTGGIKTVKKQSSIVTAFTAPGVYVYEVTEKTDAFTDTATETMTYSPAKYQMTFWVKNNAAGTGVFIETIATEIVTPDTGSTSAAGDKVDATPGDGSSTFSAMTFTNGYLKQLDITDPTTDAALSISKTVATGGDQAKYFAFDVTVSKPTTGVAGAQTYTAYIVDNTNTVVTAAANLPVGTTITSGAFTVTAGTAMTINLKHGQRIVFTDLHVGASYVAVEQARTLAADLGYTATGTYTENGGTATAFAATAAQNAALSSGMHSITEGADKSDFTNTFYTLPPTGVIINNLPYIAILLLAVGAFALFIVVKSRKRNAEGEA